MPLVDDNDVQVHLPVDKFLLEDLPDSVTQVELDVERVIKGTLSGTFSPTTLAGWSTPSNTPEYIRAIGGRLAAAFVYRLRLIEDWPDTPEYFQNLYAEAMSMLQNVVNGLVTLPEVVEIVDTGAHITAANYTPTDPVFSMEDEF
jgi:hypothetical protein